MRYTLFCNVNHVIFEKKTQVFNKSLFILQFARGKFDNVHTGIQLNALHAIEIGTYYLQNSIFDGAVEWMHYAFETIKQSPQIYYYPLMKRCFLDLVNIAIESVIENLFQSILKLSFGIKCYQKYVFSSIIRTSCQRKMVRGMYGGIMIFIIT